jgi:hypothetical protein
VGEVYGSEDAKSAALRVARNQALFRAVNEQIEASNQKFHMTLGDRADFVCECADDNCMERITVTIDQHEALRRFPTHFIVKRGHVYPEFERVVEEVEGFPSSRSTVRLASRHSSSIPAAATRLVEEHGRSSASPSGVSSSAARRIARSSTVSASSFTSSSRARSSRSPSPSAPVVPTV